MISNYVKLALRSLARDKLRSSIEIFGLAVGLSCCLLMLLFVRHERSYDGFHVDADNIYRAWVKEDYGGGETYFNSITPMALGPALDEHYPEVRRFARITEAQDMVKRGDVSLMSNMTVVDKSFLSMFDFGWIAGSRSTALDDANSVVLSESAASRFFGQEDPVGETLAIRIQGEYEEMTVTGVAADPPSNSSIQYDMLLPFDKAAAMYPPRMFTSWFNVVVETYVQLMPGAMAADLESKFPSLLESLLGDRYARSNYQVGLQPMTEIHLDASIPTGLAPVSDPAYSLILAAIALLILLVACINYMTLAVARSARRAVEVGVRKSIGADRGAIVRQFWGEAFISTLIALGLGLTLAEIFRPLFSTLAGTELEPILNGSLLGWVVLLTMVVGVVSGSYPALVLSRFQPVEILKGDVRISTDRSVIRQGLVVAQFGLSAFLITATLLVGRQLSYLESKPLGFDKELLISISTSVTPNQNRRLVGVVQEGLEITTRVGQELASNPKVIATTGSSHTFGEVWTYIGYESEEGSQHNAYLNVVDEDYIGSLGMEMAAGRNFSREIPADHRRAIIINEAFARAYALQNPIGQQLPSSRFDDHEIIGVVKDFHFESLHGEIQPVILALNPSVVMSGVSNISIEAFPTPKLMVRIASDDLPATLQQIEATWMKVNPTDDFSYAFVDQAIGAQYESERRLGSIVRIASILAVVIACLGLFGLAGLAVVRRTKEIGIRKVMGASVPRLFWLLSRDFGILLLIACVVAAPVAYLAAGNWLTQFAFSVDVTADLFLLSGLTILLVALVAVSYHGVRASLLNPADCLRYE